MPNCSTTPPLPSSARREPTAARSITALSDPGPPSCERGIFALVPVSAKISTRPVSAELKLSSSTSAEVFFGGMDTLPRWAVTVADLCGNTCHARWTLSLPSEIDT